MTPTLLTLSLEEIARRLNTQVSNGNPTISGLSFSSSSIVAGDLFVAVRGASNDGHRFIEDAFQAGAVAAVVEDGATLAGRPGVVVPNSRLARSV
jgi:UDP-N-acetylmuramyl pentapeptide synthase